MREGATGMTTITASSSLNKMTRDSSLNEDVFTESPVHQSHLTPGDQLSMTSAPSPTGYRDYKPPAELLTSGYHSSPRCDNTREETETHKTILLGDSGVGKTSLLVQFDTGTFQTGNFAATVGIGFTERMRAMEEAVRHGGTRSQRQPGPTDTVADWPASDTGGRGSRAHSTPTTGPGPIVRRQSSYDSAGEPQAPPEATELHFKVMLLGDSGVGKTCLLTRFRHGRFLSGNHISTVGIDFRNKVVTVGDTRIKLQIWDTAGQERFRSVTHAYYRDAHALLLLYDVTNKTSYDNIRAWLGEIREYAQNDVVIMLLGNKADCGPERMVKKEDGKRLADEYDVPFMETSARTGANVELAFLAIAKQLKARKNVNPDDTKFNVQDYVREQTKKSTCFMTNCQTT